MVAIIDIILIVSVGLLSVPVVVFVAEVVTAFIADTSPSTPVTINRPSICVLVPAHNESEGIAPTLADIRSQLQPGDRLLVVADNCSDGTAAVAEAAHAEVIERAEPGRIGKGFALDFGVKHLGADPPAIVIVIDADCRLGAGTLDRLAAGCAASKRPVQALDLMTAPDSASVNFQVAEFAWRVKNCARPLGLKALGLPCHLMGTGMAFPWDVIRDADLASGAIVEDLKLSLNLAAKGKPALFCPTASVTSRFPASVEGAQKQRRRWETGHVKMIVATVPSYFFTAIMQGNWRLLALTLDLAVPPLSLLAALLAGAFLATAIAAFVGSSLAAIAIVASCILAFGLSVFLAWLKWGRAVLPTSSVAAIPSYALAKLPLYRDALLRKEDSQWIRAERKKTNKTN